MYEKWNQSIPPEMAHWVPLSPGQPFLGPWNEIGQITDVAKLVVSERETRGVRTLSLLSNTPV